MRCWCEAVTQVGFYREGNKKKNHYYIQNYFERETGWHIKMNILGRWGKLHSGLIICMFRMERAWDWTRTPQIYKVMDFLRGWFWRENSLKFQHGLDPLCSTQIPVKAPQQSNGISVKQDFGGGGLLQVQARILYLFRKIPEWNDVCSPFLPLKPSWDPALWLGATWKWPRANNHLVPEGKKNPFWPKILNFLQPIFHSNRWKLNLP